MSDGRLDAGLAGAVAFVTGASGGIGRALARTFAAAGADLVLHAHSRTEALEAWVAEEGLGDRALCVRADVADADAVDAAFEAARERFGRVDACVANAGTWPPEDLPLHELPPERLHRTVAVNLLGAAHTARGWTRCLAATGPRGPGRGSAFVAIGSTAGRFGERDHADYAMSKAGLHGLVQTLKNEVVRLDPEARANLVEPGWTVTEMARPALEVDANVERAVRTMPLRQLARAEDIARAAVVLCSPTLSRHTTGQTVTVAGGMEGRQLWSDGEAPADEVRGRT